jgi:fibronectin-binding autotransporter adhesin
MSTSPESSLRARTRRGAILAGLTACAAAGPLAAAASAATTYQVTGFSDSAKACSGTVCPSLRAAVKAADKTGGTIKLHGGIYKLSGGAGRGELDVSPAHAAVTIVGAGSAHTTIKQTDGVDRVIEVDNQLPVTISGLTIAGGELRGATGPDNGAGGFALGGGILNYAKLTLNGVVVRNNFATAGSGGPGTTSTGGLGGWATAGISNQGQLTLLNSSVINNHAFAGDGGSATASGSGGPGGFAVGGIDDGSLLAGTKIANSYVADNTAQGGNGGDGYGAAFSAGGGGDAEGGINHSTQSLSIVDSRVESNAAAGGAAGVAGAGTGGTAAPTPAGAVFGAGVASTAGPVTIRSSTIDANVGSGGTGAEPNGTCGGGIFDNGPGISLVDDTIAHNSSIGARGMNGGGVGGSGSGSEGGGVCFALVAGSRGVVVNSTISDNQVLGGAGGSPGGTAGQGLGGGIWNDQHEPLTLASDTIVGNSASSEGGNVFFKNTSMIVSDTIIASGQAGDPSTADCSASSIVDRGHNLETNSQAQCLVGPSVGDVIGVNARLGSLRNNGGLTDTLALGAGSPAIDKGRVCVDPTRPGNPPLASDQRGLKRRHPCDIGAFEGQPPVNARAPMVKGAAKPGAKLACQAGSWSGDETIAFAFRWLRNGEAIAGAAKSTYLVKHGDAGHHLACRVTASNPFGNASKTSKSVKA